MAKILKRGGGDLQDTVRKNRKNDTINVYMYIYICIYKGNYKMKRLKDKDGGDELEGTQERVGKIERSRVGQQ